MLDILVYLLAAVGVWALAERLAGARAAGVEKKRLTEQERVSRQTVRKAYDRGEVGTYTFGEEDAAFQRGEWVRIAYEEYRKFFIDLSSPGDPTSRRPLEFENWIVETLRRQEYDAWRAYFAKMERRWGESLAERSIRQWPRKVAQEAIELEDLRAERPAYARSYKDLDIEALSFETWRRNQSPFHYILHPELPRPHGWAGVDSLVEHNEDDEDPAEVNGQET